MKTLFTLTVVLVITSSASAQSTEKTKTNFYSLSWLEGKWTRLNIKKPGRTSIEYWKKTSDYQLSGFGVTLKGNDTVFVEKLKIIIEGNEIHYVTDIPENPKPVHFIFTKVDTNEFTCENAAHDYPKKISYQREGNTLKAVTSGDGKMQQFVFEKMRQ